MMFSNLVVALRRLVLRANHQPQCDLLSLCEFRQSIARERARSDRTGDRFCLLAVAPAATSPIPDFYLELSAVLRQRLRLTDEAGWLDQHRVGMVLPATSPRGAWKLAADVCQQLNADHEPTCRVYCYPWEASQLDRSISDRRQDESPVNFESVAERSESFRRAGRCLGISVRQSPADVETNDRYCGGHAGPGRGAAGVSDSGSFNQARLAGTGVLSPVAHRPRRSPVSHV